MKKLLSSLLVVCFVLMIGTPVSLAQSQSAEPYRVVATTFPQYDWARQIIGDQSDRFALTLLLDSGVDLHSYQPTAADLVRIAECDLFLYVGGESDEWVEDALAQAVNPDIVAVNLLEALGDAVKTEALVEGMEHEHEDHEHEEGEAHDDHDHEEHDHEHEEELDEHVWLSLRNAAALCRTIAEALGEIDADNAAVYAANADAYIESLTALDARFQSVADAADVHTLLFADRFPFRYLADDYALDYYAAFSGCSAESEASFETLVFLTGKMDELGLKSVCTLEGSDGKMAQTVMSGMQDGDGVGVVAFDSLQSVTAQDVENGATYLAAMEKNLEALTLALGK